MEIFKDDYKLYAVCVDEAESESEDGEDYMAGLVTVPCCSPIGQL